MPRLLISRPFKSRMQGDWLVRDRRPEPVGTDGGKEHKWRNAERFVVKIWNQKGEWSWWLGAEPFCVRWRGWWRGRWGRWGGRWLRDDKNKRSSLVICEVCNGSLFLLEALEVFVVVLESFGTGLFDSWLLEFKLFDQFLFHILGLLHFFLLQFFLFLLFFLFLCLFGCLFLLLFLLFLL